MSFKWQSMDGDCNVYALFVVNAPIIRMVYSMDGDCNVYALFVVNAPIIRMVYSKVYALVSATYAKNVMFH